MTYLGHQTALKLLGLQGRPCAFDTDVFPAGAAYAGGEPWFLPFVSVGYRLRDALDRLRS
ncbi:MAG: hypothetical protein PHE36_15100 [Novosphingobium sp.]|nr:hypothetical protein [Novosphingobium sp.]